MARITRTVNVKDNLEDVILSLKKRYPIKSIPYGMQFRTDEGVINVYTSGKLVYQGEEDEFNEILRWVVTEEKDHMIFPAIGCDEAGKGEYLGPLVVSCVWVKDKNSYKDLQAQGFMDSKHINKSRLFDLYEWIKNAADGSFKVSYILYTPQQFDMAYERMGNISRILDHMYVEAVLKLPLANQIIIDRYSKGALIDRFVKNTVLEVGAEKYFHVAAASIVAKVIYEKWVEKFVPCDIAGILRQSHVSITERKKELSGIDISRWVKDAFKTKME